MVSIFKRIFGKSMNRAAGIVAVYVLFAALWIVFSDVAVDMISPSKAAALRFQTYKGLAFIFVTAAFLYAMIKNAMNRMEENAKALHSSEKIFQNLFNSTHEIIYRFEFDPPIPIGLPVEEQIRRISSGKVVQYNAAAEQTFRLAGIESAMGMTLSEIAHRPASELDQEIEAFIRNGYRQYDYEAQVFMPDGTVLHILNNAIGILEDESLVQTWSVSHEETERKLAIEALKANESKYRNLFESAGAVVLTMEVVEDDLQFIDCNHRAAEVWGLPREKIIGKSPLDYSPPTQPDGRLSAERVKEIITAAESGEPQIFEWKRYNADGELYDIEVTVVRIPEQGTYQLQAIEHDVTERKKAQEELNAAFAEIQNLKEQVEAENTYLREEIRLAHLHGDIIGRSEVMKSALLQAEQVADTDSSVLILGETGTGKELLARAIHNMSKRKDKPLVIVNCAALPSTLVESELFGREKGAYTGALTKQIGRFEAANGGTIFLASSAKLVG